MFRWVFMVLAFAAMMVYGSVVYAEEAQTAAPAPVPETAPEAAPGPEAAPAGESAPAPGDAETTDAAPVKGGGECCGCGGK